MTWPPMGRHFSRFQFGGVAFSDFLLRGGGRPSPRGDGGGGEGFGLRIFLLRLSTADTQHQSDRLQLQIIGVNYRLYLYILVFTSYQYLPIIFNWKIIESSPHQFNFFQNYISAIQPPRTNILLR